MVTHAVYSVRNFGKYCCGGPIKSVNAQERNRYAWPNPYQGSAHALTNGSVLQTGTNFAVDIKDVGHTAFGGKCSEIPFNMCIMVLI